MELPDQPIRTYALAGVLVVAVLAGALWFFVLGSDDNNGHAAPPANWAPEIQELVNFVELHRDTPFLQPVAVDALGDDEFAAALGLGADGLADDDQAHLTHAVDVLRALGLVTARTDDEEVTNEVAPQALVGNRSARYLRRERRIVVRADDLGDLDPVTEIELVGALGEALHIQYFGLTGASPLDLSTAVVGPRAVAAGVGPVFIDAYLETLRPRDRSAWAFHMTPERGDDPADVVASFVLMPEVLGEALMGLARADTVAAGSNPTWAQFDALLSAPPRTEYELIQPWAGLDGFERAAVDPPVVDEDVEILSQGSFGASSLYYLMGLRIDPRQALGASLQWAGDAYVLTRDQSGRRCFDLALEGRDGDASDRYQTALDEWVAAGPSQAQAEVSREGRTVFLRSCEPAAGASTGIIVDPDIVVAVAVNRTSLLTELRLQDMSRNRAVCIADRVLEGIPLAALQSVETTPEAEILFDELLDRSRRACRDL